jgi:putative transposase
VRATGGCCRPILAPVDGVLFRRFARLLLFRTIHDVALKMDRERAGREASPSAAVIDSQTVKAPAAQARG